ncbi:GNAT family N-acetyltransferase [Streptomyces sp. NPDC003077]|uniref:GNAT family N-acetyltransferase n=1 Tax=Streptomyces sp. NPDC003077 TaxID=3154443 RepID=UPI0033B721FD
MAEVFLRRLTRWQAEAEREAVADLYVEAYGDRSGESGGREGFLSRFAEHIQRPGFEMVTAGDPALVGCGYGFPADRTDPWWRSLCDEPPRGADRLSPSGRLFVVAELMVRPAFRHDRVATRLQQALLVRAGSPTVVTAVDSANGPARAAYRSWGWAPVEHGHQADGLPVWEAWSRTLPR